MRPLSRNVRPHDTTVNDLNQVTLTCPYCYSGCKINLGMEPTEAAARHAVAGLHWVDIERANQAPGTPQSFSRATFFRTYHQAAPYVSDIMRRYLASKVVEWNLIMKEARAEHAKDLAAAKGDATLIEVANTKFAHYHVYSDAGWDHVGHNGINCVCTVFGVPGKGGKRILLSVAYS